MMAGDHLIVDGLTLMMQPKTATPSNPSRRREAAKTGNSKAPGGEFGKRQTASSGVVCLLRTLTEPVDDLGVPIGTHNGDTRWVARWPRGWGGLTHEDMILRGGRLCGLVG